MKLKSKIKIGPHDVEISIEKLDHDVLQFTATCGDTTRYARQTLAAKYDHTPELLQHDIDERAQLLALEAAGHEQSRKLTTDLFLA